MTNYLDEIKLDLNQYVLKYGENYSTLRLKSSLMSLDKNKFNIIFDKCLHEYDYLSSFIFNIIKYIDEEDIFLIEKTKNENNNINILKSLLKESFNSNCMKQIIVNKLNFDEEDYIYE